MRSHSVRILHDERGASLVELLVALIILAVGVLAVGRVFPSTSRTQVRDKLRTSAAYYAQEKLEGLTPLQWFNPNITDGRHPAGTATESIGTNGTWQRYYQVTTMAAPLNTLKQITVTVRWTNQIPDSVTVVTYKRR
jgi:type II secretory pathway pseudopilin PulG